MCGIWLYYRRSAQFVDTYSSFQALTHRGPDCSIFHTYGNLQLGFHRLAIIDPQYASNQPFLLEDDQQTILFICNGEIYNYKEIVEQYELDPVRSDCMVIPALFRKLGSQFHTAMQHIRGEYAFVLVVLDAHKNVRQIIAGRDEIGIRPLYTNRDTDDLLFTSELKGAGFYGGAMKEFPPGTLQIATFDECGTRQMQWIKPFAVITPVVEDHLQSVRDSVIQSVKRRLGSDQPMAWLLSGGVDSSLVAALSARILGKPIRTFCCGMSGGTDLVFARKVAEHIGSEHTEVIFTAEEGLAAIEDVIRTVESWDTTTIRASVGQYLVCKHIGTKTDCRVVMVGEGPDEVCSSYLFNWYAPNGDALDSSARDYVKAIHHYDVKRADRCIARWGLEGRVALLDPEFIGAYWAIPGEQRMPTYKGMEKWWLRQAFAGTGLLLDDVLWRKKEAFSDGVSSAETGSWFQIIQSWIEDKVTDEEMRDAAAVYPYCTPCTKEAYYYRRVFCRVVGSQHQEVIPGYWQPRWDKKGEVKAYMDPSARVLGVYQSPLTPPVPIHSPPLGAVYANPHTMEQM